MNRDRCEARSRDNSLRCDDLDQCWRDYLLSGIDCAGLIEELWKECTAVGALFRSLLFDDFGLLLFISLVAVSSHPHQWTRVRHGWRRRVTCDEKNNPRKPHRH